MFKKLSIKPRPELTQLYPAIDGIPNGGKPAIRQDVLKILQQPKEDFFAWYAKSYAAVSEECARLRLISALPFLGTANASSVRVLNSYLGDGMEMQIERLEKIRLMLETIKKVYEEDCV